MRIAAVLVLILLAACAGTQPHQEATANTRLATNEWVIQLMAAIAQNWAWPPGTDPASRAWAKFQIDPNGTVQSAEIARSSGNEVFDASVIRAINKASPLPLPHDPRVFNPRITACFSPNPRNCQ